MTARVFASHGRRTPINQGDRVGCYAWVDILLAAVTTAQLCGRFDQRGFFVLWPIVVLDQS
jgi:hypothetical protein